MTSLPTVPELPFPLTPQGVQGGAAWHTGDGLVRLTAAPRTDLFHDPARDAGAGIGTGIGTDVGTTAGKGEPVRLVGRVNGDFQLAARVHTAFRDVFDAGVLFLHHDAHAWAKLCFEQTSPTVHGVVSVVTRGGDSDDANSHPVEDDRVWLRVSRTGRAFAFHSSPDGHRWDLVRYFSLGPAPFPETVTVGFLAQSPQGEGCVSVFDHITFHPEAPKDLRDGS